MCRKGSIIPALTFVDDCIIFLCANKEFVQNIKKIIVDFSSFSGQSLNISKYALYFSPSTSGRLIKSSKSQDKYLRVPLLMGELPNRFFKIYFLKWIRN